MPQMIVIIRPIEQGDADYVQELAVAPEIAATSNVPCPYPVDGGQKFVMSSIAANQERKSFVFAVIAEGRFVGVASLLEPDYSGCSIKTGYWIGIPFWNRGYATAALRQLTEYATSTLSLRRVIGECLERNLPSRRVLEKCDFVKVNEFSYVGPWPERFGREKCLRFEYIVA